MKNNVDNWYKPGPVHVRQMTEAERDFYERSGQRNSGIHGGRKPATGKLNTINGENTNARLQSLNGSLVVRFSFTCKWLLCGTR